MLTWMADVLRRAGLSVLEIPGWQTRGHADLNSNDVLGVILHHTAGPAAGNFPSLHVVRDGRPDLEGPLAQLGLARDGTWLVIAAGVAWHAGKGAIPWCPTDAANQHTIGVEAESVGYLINGKPDWTPQQLSAYPRGVAALLTHLNLPAARAIAHREWAPIRKVDPVGIDMPAFRLQVAGVMSVPPPTRPMPTTPEDDVSWTHADGAPTVHDFYRAPGETQDRPDLADPLLALGIVTAHAAYARDAARDAAAKVDALRADMAAGRVGMQIDYTALAQALLAQMGQPK